MSKESVTPPQPEVVGTYDPSIRLHSHNEDGEWAQDIYDCVEIGLRYGIERGNQALDTRLRHLAVTGDEKVKELINLADTLGVPTCELRVDRGGFVNPSTMEQSADTIMYRARDLGKLTVEMVENFFRVGLIDEQRRNIYKEDAINL